MPREMDEEVSGFLKEGAMVIGRNANEDERRICTCFRGVSAPSPFLLRRTLSLRKTSGFFLFFFGKRGSK